MLKHIIPMLNQILPTMFEGRRHDKKERRKGIGVSGRGLQSILLLEKLSSTSVGRDRSTASITAINSRQKTRRNKKDLRHQTALLFVAYKKMKNSDGFNASSGATADVRFYLPQIHVTARHGTVLFQYHQQSSTAEQS